KGQQDQRDRQQSPSRQRKRRQARQQNQRRRGRNCQHSKKQRKRRKTAHAGSLRPERLTATGKHSAAKTRKREIGRRAGLTSKLPFAFSRLLHATTVMYRGAMTGRLAPTPSGYLHLGNARSFLLAWLWAR